ncbi:hypothetical protein N4G70_36570 [Streptomyces sp. ASQP_92]|uniref:hypothetical protein n=1 Tax=Streptomyces sp. ASQP_92 TaxID=2979116 RepID=UPI0021BED110|nr:hypothetical protein [Streptomyces sp. ASQP_92]MCT9094310.1 hypothetical protein [Streptomyces sp. ASQP_92]
MSGAEGPMEMTAIRMAAAVLSTWASLIVLLLAPTLLPEHWRYYIYSPASVGLWLLAMLVAPVVVCIVTWPWIKSGVR